MLKVNKVTINNLGLIKVSKMITNLNLLKVSKSDIIKEQQPKKQSS